MGQKSHKKTKEQEAKNKNVLIYCMGFVDKLVSYNIFDGPQVLNDEGRVEYDALIASGYEPDTEEAAKCCQYILSGDMEKDSIACQAKKEFSKPH